MVIYQRRIEQGLCGACGTDRGKNKARCNGCKEKARLNASDKREKANAAGMCCTCYKRPRVEEKSRCEKCLLASAASTRRKVQQRKRDNLCPTCGQSAMPGKTVCKQCSGRMSEISSERYHERRAAGKCSYCDNDPVEGATMCQHHLDQTKQQRETLKLEVMNAYGGPRCAWCNETDVRYLEIDHIEGGGRQHGIEHEYGSGHGLRCWLKANNFPPGFRILCRTCNNKSHVERCRESDMRLTDRQPATH
jgi:hypothetical protein